MTAAWVCIEPFLKYSPPTLVSGWMSVNHLIGHFTANGLYVPGQIRPLVPGNGDGRFP